MKMKRMFLYRDPIHEYEQCEERISSFVYTTEKGLVKQESDDQNIPYRPNAQQVLKSAYREKNGSEPVYTNFSHTIAMIQTSVLLWITFFCNGQLTVENVLEQPNHPSNESYPDETHPLDRLMIAVTFRLQWFYTKNNLFCIILR
jgi:hypothetical protein